MISRTDKDRIAISAFVVLLGATALIFAILYAILRTITTSGIIVLLIGYISLVFGSMGYSWAKGWLTNWATNKRWRQQHALDDPTWVRKIGPLVVAVERAIDELTRESEIAELTRILPHVRDHHRKLIDDQHLHHLLRLMLNEAQKSPEFLCAGLAAIGHLGWIEAIDPLEELAREGTGKTSADQALIDCLSVLHDRARAVHDHDTLVRPTDTRPETDATLLRPIKSVTKGNPEQLLHVTDEVSEENER